MSTPDIERLQSIKTLPSLIAYLRDELDWPIEAGDAEDITFEYSPSELGIDEKSAVRIKEIKQLRPLTGNQPWGIFFVNFEKKRLPVVVMRLILRALVFKKRASANNAERQAWQPHDLLFISAYGEDTDRAITFAHFVENPGTHLTELRVLGWDDDDTPLHMDYVARMLQEKLTWDDKLASDPDAWRARWTDAFLLRHRFVITKSDELAEALAVLARRLRARIRTILRMEDGFGDIRKLQRAFKAGLIHDLDDDGFADMFAQTVTYGLFSVSVRRTFPGEGTALTKDDVPNLIFTSPFLKEMLGVFLGIKSRKGAIDFDELGVSDVTDLLTSPDTHMEVVLADFNNKTRGEDPVIHFYEHFLNAYNKQLKIQRGVFYTPQPVVSYIVRSVHELLQTEFGLADGLADTTTWGAMLKKHPGLKLPPLTDEPGEKRTISPDEPFVQILDPATGTATFLVEVIDVIHRTLAARWKQQRLTDAQQRAAWNDYVPHHLLPRLHAFELMMAPYAIAHMKIGLKLAETGYRFGTEERARIYLTNALEPKVKQLPQIGFDALAHEAAAVNEIKWYKRFTVVIGNPPYANFGQLNRIPFILNLLNDYKRGLDEKKLNLDDDYLKFFRMGQYLLGCSGRGVFGMITNSSFLDGLVHRKMREALLTQFPVGYIADLHGNSRRGDITPDGSVDENVFDIQQGVSISVFSNGVLGNSHQIRNCELWGTRESKYQTLSTNTMLSVPTKELEARSPQFFFIAQSGSMRDEYEAGVPFGEVFSVVGSGLNTDRDELCIDFNKTALSERMQNVFSGKMDADFIKTYNFHPSSSYDPAALAKRQAFDSKALRVCIYRPFDFRNIYYKVGFTSRPVFEVQGHMLRPNLGLLVCRQSKEPFAVLATRHLSTHKIVAVYDRTSLAPLWLYQNDRGGQQALRGEDARMPTFKATFAKALAEQLGLRRSDHGLPAGLTPEDIFHYAYAMFHSPDYRTRYAEFLKIDFPRLPLTRNLELFRVLACLGGELVALHLLESPKLNQPITEFIGGQNPEVEKVSWSKNTVWLDKAQTTGFKGVREEVWNFHIGGYQVCEKWLKDRKGRTLASDDIAHYHKIVIALTETIRLMGEIDEVIEENGGWPLK